VCCGLLYVHSHRGTEANGYLDCQWYDHTNTVKGGNKGCGKPRWVCNVVRKWVDNKRNVSVVVQANNQTLALRPAHEWRCVCVISERTFTRREANLCSCKRSTKETYNWG
jgi:hypothetical protein